MCLQVKLCRLQTAPYLCVSSWRSSFRTNKKLELIWNASVLCNYKHTCAPFRYLLSVVGVAPTILYYDCLKLYILLDIFCTSSSFDTYAFPSIKNLVLTAKIYIFFTIYHKFSSEFLPIVTKLKRRYRSQFIFIFYKGCTKLYKSWI